MGLLGAPKLLVADEPTTALDVHVQAQVLELLQHLRRETKLALLFISHDLAVVAGVADRIMVMYAGRIVESAASGVLLRSPRHPYSAALIRCMPSMRSDLGARMATLPGYPPRAGEQIAGCAFAPRCPKAQGRCANERPPLIADAQGSIACHFPEAP
jgi:oligopeptide/dipeptide ABC transporter ATP-binding protein